MPWMLPQHQVIHSLIQSCRRQSRAIMPDINHQALQETPSGYAPHALQQLYPRQLGWTIALQSKADWSPTISSPLNLMSLQTDATYQEDQWAIYQTVIQQGAKLGNQSGICYHHILMGIIHGRADLLFITHITKLWRRHQKTTRRHQKTMRRHQKTMKRRH